MPAPGHPGHRRQPGEPGEVEALVAQPVEVRRGGAQHQTLQALGAVTGEELGHGTAHRVADGDEPVDAHSVGHRDTSSAQSDSRTGLAERMPRPWPR